MKRTIFRTNDIGKTVESFVKGKRKIGISGGRSVVPFLERVMEWKEKPLFALVDERLEGERNYDLLRKYIPDENIIYSLESQGFLDAIMDSEILVMGVGEDCHIASIFPGKSYSGLVDVMEDSPKPPPKRITITPEFLEKFDGDVILIFKGEEKRNALERFLRGECHNYLKNVIIVTDVME